MLLGTWLVYLRAAGCVEAAEVDKKQAKTTADPYGMTTKKQATADPYGMTTKKDNSRSLRDDN
jgi:hypothetical protein